jgi:hypothetical protein
MSSEDNPLIFEGFFVVNFEKPRKSTKVNKLHNESKAPLKNGNYESWYS